MDYTLILIITTCLISLTESKLDGPGENVCEISKLTTQYVEREVERVKWGIKVVPRNLCFCVPFFCDEMYYWQKRGGFWGCVMDKLYVTLKMEWVCETVEVTDYYCCKGFKEIQGNCVKEMLCQENNGGCDQLCLAKSCDCYDGYIYDESEEICIDINECGTANGGCSDTCVNTQGSYYCECGKGFHLIDHRKCVDVDECDLGNGGCQQICQNQIGSWTCECNAGYELDDHFKCDQISMCDNSDGTMKCNEFCLNRTSTKEKCTCDENMLQMTIRTHCKEKNPCTTDNGGCSHICSFEDKQLTCECPDGFDRIDDYKCENINECEQNNGGCSHACTDMIGDFECFCPFGFSLSVDEKTCIGDLGTQGQHDDEEALPSASIIGAVIGGIVFLCLMIFITFFLRSKGNWHQMSSKLKVLSGKGFDNMAYEKNINANVSNPSTPVYSNATSPYDNGLKPTKENVYSNNMDNFDVPIYSDPTKSDYSCPPTNPPPRLIDQPESEINSLYPTLYELNKQ